MISVAILDDDVKIIEELQEIIENHFRTRFKIKTYKSCLELDIARDKEEFDIYFIDIEIGAENGVDYAVKIRETNEIAEIIFITSHEKYAVSGYDARPMAYLLKPIDNKKLKTVLNEIIKDRASGKSLLEITVANKKQIIKIDHILSIKRTGRTCSITTRTDEFEVYDSLKNLRSRLDNQLIRVSESSYINPLYLTQTDEIHGQIVARMINGESIPFSRSGYRDFKFALSKWSLKKL
ncbi:LytR/AlgR family response regulator transcription factor [Microaceticoccus formicicus]|uniref:LytR/AlgR family response regulator transcription factor n=1 Tax=Microaceticoccus formicicus TaxID=3118105 RepID=UPI003CD00F88|nr:LytTR family DNA-binding domain-containing protein [Peptoniphilaceae bacterium AMB_02]